MDNRGRMNHRDATAWAEPVITLWRQRLVVRTVQITGCMRYRLVPRFINTTTFVASIFGSGEARRESIPRSGAVTEEQRGQNRKATQPFGRRFFLAQTSLLAPYRPLKGMRVTRASSGPKSPRSKRGCIYEMGYFARRVAALLACGFVSRRGTEA